MRGIQFMSIIQYAVEQDANILRGKNMHTLGQILLVLLDIYVWIIIASVIISWLIAFEVINVRNPQAANIVRLLNKVTEPVYKPIRKFIPPIGGIDITPIIVIIAIYLLQNLIAELFLFGPY